MARIVGLGTTISMLLAGIASAHPSAVARDAMLATVHPLATEAGLQVLREGGNAVDAALAAAVTLGVVDNHNSGIGGGCFILIRRANKELVAIDGREMAPAAATRDMYLVEGRADTTLSQTGPLAVAVPGAVAAYERALQKCGTKSLADIFLPAARLADAGFILSSSQAALFRAHAAAFRQFDGTRSTLLKPDGSTFREGELFRQPDLAATYRQLAEQGSDGFYRGEFASRVSDWMAAHGGLLTRDDFASYQAYERRPIVTTYRDYEVVGFPPPSSGGVHVAQILNILEHFDLANHQRRDPEEAQHILTEAMKLAFADRAFWLGDADFAPVPRGLVGKSYAQQLAQRIHLDHASAVEQQGTPSDWQTDLFGKHTTHIAAADAAGNWVAMTATINTSFGSKVIVPGTGVILNNEMDDFSAQPGVPNAFGLVGAENNAVEPGKRPLSSMSPTIVLKNDEPLLTVGAAGGPKIITQVVLTIVRCLDYGLTLDEALAAPRLHHQWRPDLLMVESGLPPDQLAGLLRRGHALQLMSSGGVTQAILRREDGAFEGAHDPRVAGRADGL